MSTGRKKTKIELHFQVMTRQIDMITELLFAQQSIKTSHKLLKQLLTLFKTDAQLLYCFSKLKVYKQSTVHNRSLKAIKIIN